TRRRWFNSTISDRGRSATATRKTTRAGSRSNPARSEGMVAWDHVTRAHVLRAIKEYDRLGQEWFFSEHGFAPTTTYERDWEGRHYPPKAISGRGTPAAVKAARWRPATSARSAPAIVLSNRRW